MQQDKLMLKISQPLLKLTQESESIILVSSTKGEGSEQWNPLCQVSETKSKFGIELSLGTKLQSLYPKPQIALIKHALSGCQSISTMESGKRHKNIRGEEYINFIKTVKDAIISLKQQGYRPIKGLWFGKRRSRRTSYSWNQHLANIVQSKEFYKTNSKRINSENMLFVYGTVIPIAASTLLQGVNW